MPNDFKNEIPKGRINMVIEYEKYGARKRKELPLKLLILADLSQQEGLDNMVHQERVVINKTNFDAVLSKVQPTLTYQVPNALSNSSELTVNLQFEQFKDFHPEHIVSTIPELRQLLGMRNVLKDLKVNFLNNVSLRQELEAMLAVKNEFSVLKKTLDNLPLRSGATIQVGE